MVTWNTVVYNILEEYNEDHEDRLWFFSMLQATHPDILDIKAVSRRFSIRNYHITILRHSDSNTYVFQSISTDDGGLRYVNDQMEFCDDFDNCLIGILETLTTTGRFPKEL